MNQDASFHHIPVMLAETMDALSVKSGGCYVDGTLGGGGHSEAILQQGGIVYGIDRDLDALSATAARLDGYPHFHAVHGNFHDMKALLVEENVQAVEGILLDLGVSSHQLDTAERGFSYHTDAPLDMRMDQSQTLSARQLVNTWSAGEIAEILRTYGDEKWAVRIAAMIVEHRQKAPLETTADLVRAVDAAIPRKIRDLDKGHSAQKTFQAIRIAVNDEIAPLAHALSDAVSLLVENGRLCVLTFHSLEDRVVKRAFREMENPCTCPPGIPVCICSKKPVARLPVRSAIQPSAQEVKQNPRARSAKLRVAEKI